MLLGLLATTLVLVIRAARPVAAHDQGWRVSTPNHICVDDSYTTFNNAAVQAMVADYNTISPLVMYNESFTCPYTHLKIVTTWQ